MNARVSNSNGIAQILKTHRVESSALNQILSCNKDSGPGVCCVIRHNMTVPVSWQAVHHSDWIGVTEDCADHSVLG